MDECVVAGPRELLPIFSLLFDVTRDPILGNDPVDGDFARTAGLWHLVSIDTELLTPVLGQLADHFSG